MSEFTDLAPVLAERLTCWCKSQDASVKCAAIDGIRRLGISDSATVMVLEACLKDRDPDVRTHAAWALGDLKADIALESLVELLKSDPAGEARIEAVKALGKVGAERAGGPLMDCVLNEGYPELDGYGAENDFNLCWEVQREALEALGKVSGPAIEESLMNFIGGCDYDDLRDQAINILIDLDRQCAYQYVHKQIKTGEAAAIRQAVHALADSKINRGSSPGLPDELVVDLNRLLAHNDPAIRLNAARALANLDDPPASMALCRLLLDDDHSVREEATELLGRSADREMASLLQDMLKISDTELQRKVAAILGRIGDAESALAMSDLLALPDEALQVQLVKGIGTTGDASLVLPLLDFLEGSISGELQLLTIIALGQVVSRDPSGAADSDAVGVASGAARDSLFPFVFSPDRTLSSAALEAYAICHADATVVLLGFVQIAGHEESRPGDEDDENEEVRIPLRDISRESDESPDAQSTDSGVTMEEETIPLQQFVDELPSDGDPASSTLASIISRRPEDLPAGKTAPPVSGLGCDDWIPIHAARLLIDYAVLDESVIDTLLEVATGAGESLLREIIGVLGHAGTPKALPLVERCIKERAGETRLAALDALNRIALPLSDVSIIEKLLDDEDLLVRQRAVGLLALDDPRTHRWLKDALDSEDHQIRVAAIDAVTKANFNSGLRDFFMNLLVQGRDDLAVPIARALRRVEDNKAVRCLLSKVENENLADLHWIFINTLVETCAPRMGHG